jgi:hypothetical protein
MRHSKEKLLLKGSAGQTYESAGPIWLGARLSSSKFPGGYANLIYNKGAWVLHMLRYLMQDPNSGVEPELLFVDERLSCDLSGPTSLY